MARSLGSTSTKESKAFAMEIEKLIETPYKYNLNIMRLIEVLLCQRVAEKVAEFPEGTDVTDKIVTVEIPLIGEITFKPSVFHKAHRITSESSVHFDMEFKPTSCFKFDIIRAYKEGSSELTDIFSSIYSERIQELYSKLKAGESDGVGYRNTKLG